MAKAYKKNKLLTFYNSLKVSSYDLPRGPVQLSSSVETLHTDLRELISTLDKSSKNALTILRDIIKNISEPNKHWMRSWSDEKGFDLLQSFIISNRPDLIHLILHTSGIFPPSYQPKINPYAHLAATLGHLDCLKEVLAKRPEDYFQTSTPQHAIKLPLGLMPRPKLVRRMAGKHTERLMRTIKQDTANAERAVLDPDDTTTDKTFMEKEFENLRMSFKVQTKVNKPHRTFLFPPTFVSSDTFKAKKQNNDIPEQDFCPKALKPKLPKPKITVFWDVFKNDSEGVVKGAGEPVKTIYVKNKKQSHRRHILERNDVVSYKKKILPRIKPSQSNNEKEKKSKTNVNDKKSKTSLMSIEHGSRTDHRFSTSTSTSSIITQPRLELGVRRIKKYKDFIPIIETRQLQIDDPNKYIGKTPLTMAAEKGHVDCVNYLLQLLHKTTSTGPSEPLILATKERSPESLAILLEGKYPRKDFQGAVLMSIRELYPDCLGVLLNLGMKDRDQIFDGTNLFHILYSQSLIANYRYEMLPEMTRVLVNSGEDVRARYPNKTYPIYTLIQCAFHVPAGKQLFHYLECLTMLLNANANPHFNEDKGDRCYYQNALNLSRPGYSSAIKCVLFNANVSLQYFENSYWCQIIMQKFIEAIATHDKTPRRVNNDILFTYMEYVSQFGLNRRILRTLLRYGANPDHSVDGKYPLTMFFEQMFSFLTKFQVFNKFATNDDILNALLILCRAMAPNCLHEAVVHFLDNHLLSTPLQSLDITRKFCYHANKMITSPRSLTHIASQTIWLHLRRNSNQAQLLPLPQDMIQQILP